MNKDSARKLVEMVLHILNVTGGTDIYHINKILYFAEMDHIVNNGLSMVPGGFVALEYGPVPEDVYRSLKHIGNGDCIISTMLDEIVEKLGNEASDIFIAKRQSDDDYLAKSELDSLNKSIADNADLSFTQLKRKSHDIAWRDAYNSTGKKTIKPEMIAKAGNASAGMIEYVREQSELDKVLS